MIRIALVEDDATYRDEFIEYLRRYESESGQRFQISVFTDGDEIAENYTASYDIILMDIAMRFMDGMTAAEEIRKADSEVVIIFITASPQYAIRGYTVDALDYVLKPVTYFSFTQRIDRAIRRMGKRQSGFISISTRGGVKRIGISTIKYVEVQDHDLVYHTTDDDIRTRGSLGDVEESLGTDRFFRCSKCYLVNLEFVDSIQNNDIIVDGEAIQVSRARKKAAMDALNEYLSEVSK